MRNKLFIFLIILLLGVNIGYGLLTDSIIAYYKLDDNITNPIDSHSIYNLTRYGTPTYLSSAKLNGGYNMTTTNQLAMALNYSKTSISGNEDLCLSAWIYFAPTVGSAQYQWILKLTNSSDANKYPLAISSGATFASQIQLLQSNGSTSFSNSVNVSRGQWNHYVFCRDFTNNRVYIYENTTQLLNQSITARAFNGQWYLEFMDNTNANSGSASTHSFDEVGIWNKILTTSEISQLYNSGAGLTYPFGLVQNFSVTSVNVWNLSSINIFNLTMTSGVITYNYGTTTGTITTEVLVNSSLLWNLTYWDSNNQYFNLTYNNINVSSAHIGNLYQSIINFSCYEKITNNSLNCVNSTIYPNVGYYNFSILVNGYYNIITNNSNINLLDNKTLNITGFYSSNVSFKTNFLTGSGGNVNCSYVVNSLNNTYQETVFTTVTNTSIGLINGSYNVTAMCLNYAYAYANFTVDGTTENVTFNIYTTNSFNIAFYDEFTKEIIDYSNISLEIISDVYSENYTTQNGTLYIDLLTPSFYLFRYYGEYDYSERFYYYTLENNTFNNISLYLINDTVSITLTVRDDDNDLIEDAYIKIQRYDLDTNAYTTREIVKTNVFGNAYFSGILNNEFYKFIVEYPFGTQVLETSPDYIRSNTLTLRVSLDNVNLDDYFTSINTYANLSFNNITNTFRCYYNDASSGVTIGCLNIYEGDTLYNDSCVDSSSSTIILGVLNETGVTYTAQCLITLNSETYLLDTLTHTFYKEIPTTAKNTFFTLTLLLTLIIALITMQNLTIMFIVTPLPLFIMSLIQIIPINRSVGITLMLIGITLSFLTSKRT